MKITKKLFRRKIARAQSLKAELQQKHSIKKKFLNSIILIFLTNYFAVNKIKLKIKF